MSLEPARYNFKIWKGATFRKRLTLLTEGTGSLPRDLTDYDGYLAIRPKANQTPLLELTVDDGGITYGGVAGTIDLYISADDTAAITWSSGVYDLIITSPSGDVDPLLYGKFTARGI